eukprot:jgi/Mesvir1/22579/Mv21223-RA.1
MISRHLQQYVDNNCVGGAQMDVLLEDGVDGAKRAVIRLSEMDDDKEDVNIRLKRHDDNTADCVFGSRGVADERQVFHDAAEKVVEWMMGAKVASVGSECARDSSRRALPCRACRSSPKEGESVHESAAVPSTARDPPATSKPVATGDMPPPRQGEGGRGSMEGKKMFSK